MNYVRPSRYLQILASVGKPVDVLLLSRIGPSTCLFVDSQQFRQQQTANLCSATNPYGLDDQRAFQFYVNQIEQANRVVPIANIVGPYAHHLHHAVTAPISPRLYFLLAAIESNVPGIGDDMVRHIEADQETLADVGPLLASKFYSSHLPSIYGVPVPKADEANPDQVFEDCTIAEFLLGRSAELGTLCVPIMMSPPFKRHISVCVLDQAILSMRLQEKAGALKVSFLPVEIPASAIELDAATDERRMFQLTDDARKIAEQSVQREPETCGEWFSALVRDRDRIADLLKIGEGDIRLGVSEHRLQYVRRLTDQEVEHEYARRKKANTESIAFAKRAIEQAAPAVATNSTNSTDADDDVDDKK